MSKRMYRFDFVRHVIYVDANYLKRAENPKTRAYQTLNQLMAENPNFTIKSEGVVKDHYNHLTYNVMINFFKANGYIDALEELEKMRTDKSLKYKNGRNIRKYNTGVIRGWFIKNYGHAAKAQGYLDNEAATDTTSVTASSPADSSSNGHVTAINSCRLDEQTNSQDKAA